MKLLELRNGDKLVLDITSQENCFLQEDYPYGRYLRCQRRAWVEKKEGFGKRLVTQTSNPRRNNDWLNKPSCSTYSTLVFPYIRPETGHLEMKSQHGSGWYDEIKKIFEWLGPEGFKAIDATDFAYITNELAVHGAIRDMGTTTWNELIIGKSEEEKASVKAEHAIRANNIIANMKAMRDV